MFLDDALRLSGERAQVSFTEEELRSLRELVNLGSPDWDVLFNLFHTRGVHPLSFLQSREFIDLLRKSAWRNIRMWPTPTLSIPCAPCCCRCCT